MFCTSCGTKNTAENNFCRQCGHRLEKVAATLKISEEAFDRALPDDEQVSALLELAYRRRKDDDLPGAIALCEEALKLNPDSTSAHSLLGQLYEAGGHREEAIRQYERVLELNPGSIADRVKLDQLRGETAPTPAKKSAPRITLVDHDASRAPGGIFLAIGVALILIMLGGVLALQLPQLLHPRSTEMARTPTKPEDPGVTLSTPSNTGATTAQRSSGDRSNSETSNSTALANTSPPTGFGPLGPSPFEFNPQRQPVRTNRLPAPAYVGPESGGDFRPPVTPVSISNQSRPTPRNTSAKKDGADSGDSGSSAKVHLPDPETIVITVKPDHSPNATGGTSGNGNGNGGGGEPPPVHTDPPANLAGADARGFIAVGQDKMTRMDYSGAITAFRNALKSGANDDTGYVCEQIAHCYKGKGDNKSAISWYDTAIQKYKDLVSAGRQAEASRNGIRACENGKKICSGE